MHGAAVRFLLAMLAALIMLAGCSQEGVQAPQELRAFLEELKANDVDGSLFLRAPLNEDMEYVAEYTIARYASTRVITLFRFVNAERAEAGLREALKNDKLSGQARNANFVMAATFYPPDDAAVEQIRALFLAHSFD
jgi:hypothetical protein